MSNKRILFVDDEANVINGLKRMLHQQRSEWDMVFVTCAADALRRMSEAPFDVIVTDLVMPEMSGEELLKKVVHLYPEMARVVLSGHADEKTTSRAAQVAHRFLSKPSDADEIKRAIAQVCSSQLTVHDERIHAIVASCRTLPSPPQLYIEVTRAAESDTCDAKDIGRIISRDMSMSAKILQLVNSSFFGVGRRVSSIDQTVALLGTIRIKGLILTEHIFSEFKPPVPIEEFAISDLWRHSFEVAEVARLISKEEKQGDDRPDQAFMAGLLHDIGKLVLAAQFPEAFRDVLRLARTGSMPIHSIEMDLLGVNHAAIGGYLLGLWALPARIVEAVSLHHTPSGIPYDGLCALTAVHVADALVGLQCESAAAYDVNEDSSDLDIVYLSRIGLTGRLERWRELAAETMAHSTAERV